MREGDLTQMARRSGWERESSIPRRHSNPFLSQHHPMRCHRPHQTPGASTHGRCSPLTGGWFLNQMHSFLRQDFFLGIGARSDLFPLPYLPPSLSFLPPQQARAQKAKGGPGRREEVDPEESGLHQGLARALCCALHPTHP